jgi:5,10-methylenetetrahydrofolate reductase
MSLKEKNKSHQFTITVELDPPKSASSEKTQQEASRLAGWVDAVNIADCPMAKLRMSPIALSHIVQEKYQLETIFHLTCRDRNLLGLQAELLGAAALGVNNILTLTGDDPSIGDHPQAHPVYELDSTGLIEAARTLNSGYDCAGHALDTPSHFYIGTTANPNAGDLDSEMKRLEGKKKAGAEFIQTQPIFDLTAARRFLEAAKDLHMSVLFGVLPLKSEKMARYLHEKVPGIVIPKDMIQQMAEGGKKAGTEIAVRTSEEIRSLGAAGVHIMPLNDMDTVLTIVQEMG